MRIITRNLHFSDDFFKYSNIYANVVFVAFIALSLMHFFEPFVVSVEFETMTIILAIFVVLFALGNIKADGIVRKNNLTLDQASGAAIVFAFSLVIMYFLAVIIFSFDNRIPVNSGILASGVGFFIASAHGIKAANLVRKGRDYGFAYIILSFVFVLTLSSISNIGLLASTPFVRGFYYFLLEAVKNR